MPLPLRENRPKPCPMSGGPGQPVRVLSPVAFFRKFYEAFLQSLKPLQLEWALWREDTPARMRDHGRGSPLVAGGMAGTERIRCWRPRHGGCRE